MVAFLIGIIGGTIELLLLRILVKNITNAKTLPLWIIPAKLVVLAFFLIPCALFWPEDLVWTGAAIAGVLVIGALCQFAFDFYKKESETKK